jgi:hypothetical protein
VVEASREVPGAINEGQGILHVHSPGVSSTPEGEDAVDATKDLAAYDAASFAGPVSNTSITTVVAARLPCGSPGGPPRAPLPGAAAGPPRRPPGCPPPTTTTPPGDSAAASLRPRLSGCSSNIFGHLLPYFSSDSDDDGEEEASSDNFLQQGEEENVEVRNFRL